MNNPFSFRFQMCVMTILTCFVSHKINGQYLFGPEISTYYNRAIFSDPARRLKSRGSIGYSYGIVTQSNPANRVSLLIDLKIQQLKTQFTNDETTFIKKISSTYINLPARISFDIRKKSKNGNAEIRVYLGPDVSYWLNSRATFWDDQSHAEKLRLADLIPISRRIQYGYQFGVSILKAATVGKYGITIRLNNSISNQINNVSSPQGGKDYRTDLTFRNQSISISGVYYIDVLAWSSSKFKKKILRKKILIRKHWKEDI